MNAAGVASQTREPGTAPAPAALEGSSSVEAEHVSARVIRAGAFAQNQDAAPRPLGYLEQ
jgi:hypothetical protein